jgi:hypothetical protein
MKYTIEGFSQQKLVSLSLDVSDALILRWFTDFSASGNMLKYISDGIPYYLVKYRTLISDLPILGITTVKGISLRFEKYVQAGLMKMVYRNTPAGRCSYFTLTKKVIELEYEQEAASVAQPPAPEKKPVSVPAASPENSASHGSGNTEAQRTPVTMAPYPKELQLPCPENLASHALNNSSTRNSSTTATAVVTTGSESEKKRQTADKITGILKKYFDVSVFSADFIPHLADAVSKKLTENDIGPYLEWAFDVCRQKKPGNLSAYFYKTAGEPYFIAAFLSGKKTSGSDNRQEKPPPLYTCPVCGTKHNVLSDCPVCGFFFQDRQNTDVIERQKKVWRLPETQKTALKAALIQAAKENRADSFDMESHYRWKAAEAAVYKKFTG